MNTLDQTGGSEEEAALVSLFETMALEGSTNNGSQQAKETVSLNGNRTKHTVHGARRNNGARTYNLFSTEKAHDFHDGSIGVQPDPDNPLLWNNGKPK